MTPSLPECSETCPASPLWFWAGFSGTQLSDSSRTPLTHLNTHPARGSEAKEASLNVSDKQEMEIFFRNQGPYTKFTGSMMNSSAT